MPLVQLKHGDMFNGPCDMIVLPCSTGGTITNFVWQRIVRHNMPHPRPQMKLGTVSIVPSTGGENIAQYIAHAASVEASSSTPGAILRIGRELGKATKKYPAIRLVSSPLLGAGAGGLDVMVVANQLSMGFKATAHADARLIIYVLDKIVFKGLSSMSEHASRSTELATHPNSSDPRNVSHTNQAWDSAPQFEKSRRIFISYSHSSDEHRDWVKELGTFLRQNGVDARLDLWHLRRGMDLPQFMTNELTLAERVIIVSDEKFAEKANGRLGGVGWETMIVQGDMAKLPPESTKYLTIVRSNDLDNGLPHYLKTKFVIHWPIKASDATNRQMLLREIYDIIDVPSIGPKPLLL